MSEFKETPRTKVAKKYLKDDPIMEDDEENRTSQRDTYASFRRGRKFS